MVMPATRVIRSIVCLNNYVYDMTANVINFGAGVEFFLFVQFSVCNIVALNCPDGKKNALSGYLLP